MITTVDTKEKQRTRVIFVAFFFLCALSGYTFLAVFKNERM
jgi:hypothetical protein